MSPRTLRRVARVAGREAARSLGLLLAVTLSMYALLELAPGDPVALHVNADALSDAELLQVRHELALEVFASGWLCRPSARSSLMTIRCPCAPRYGWRSVMGAPLRASSIVDVTSSSRPATASGTRIRIRRSRTTFGVRSGLRCAAAAASVE